MSVTSHEWGCGVFWGGWGFHEGLKKREEKREDGESCRTSRERGCGCLSKEGLVGRGKVRDMEGQKTEKSVSGVCE